MRNKEEILYNSVNTPSSERKAYTTVEHSSWTIILNTHSASTSIPLEQTILQKGISATE